MAFELHYTNYTIFDYNLFQLIFSINLPIFKFISYILNEILPAYIIFRPYNIISVREGRTY